MGLRGSRKGEQFAGYKEAKGKHTGHFGLALTLRCCSAHMSIMLICSAHWLRFMLSPESSRMPFESRQPNRRSSSAPQGLKAPAPPFLASLTLASTFLMSLLGIRTLGLPCS